jgi:hypothetical protein
LAERLETSTLSIIAAAFGVVKLRLKATMPGLFIKWARYNHAMLSRTAVNVARISTLVLSVALMLNVACTVYRDVPARTLSEATGGESLERMFWKNVQSGDWAQVERSLASNYSGMSTTGPLDRAATIAQYRTWQLKTFSIGDLKTEMNGSTLVVTYSVTLSGSVLNSSPQQPLPSLQQHMMSVWQQQKAGWTMIAHSVVSE